MKSEFSPCFGILHNIVNVFLVSVLLQENNDPMSCIEHLFPYWERGDSAEALGVFIFCFYPEFFIKIWLEMIFLETIGRIASTQHLLDDLAPKER